MIRPHAVIRRRVVFRDDAAKLAFMRSRVAKAARDPEIVRTASELVRPYRSDDWAGQVREICAFVREAIRYQHDPDNREQLADGRAVLDKAYDDCDGKAELAAAMMRAVGIRADLHPVWRGPIMTHVQAMACWPGSEHYPGARPDGWIVCETTIAGVNPGENPLAVPKNPNTGRLPLR